VGEDGLWSGEGTVAGIYNKVSFSAGYDQYSTDGWRENAFQKDKIGNAFVQVELSPETSIQAEYRHRDLENGDIQQRFFAEDFNPGQKDSLKRNTRSHRVPSSSSRRPHRMRTVTTSTTTSRVRARSSRPRARRRTTASRSNTSSGRRSSTSAAARATSTSTARFGRDWHSRLPLPVLPVAPPVVPPVVTSSSRRTPPSRTSTITSTPTSMRTSSRLPS
jgi:hypothetical protein